MNYLHPLGPVLSVLLIVVLCFDSSTQEIVESPWRRLQKLNQQPKLAQRQKRAPAGGLFEGRVSRMNYLHPLGPVLSALLIVVLC